LDYDEAQAAEWAIAHNRTAELATWDYTQLAATIAAHPDVDWEGVGYDSTELEAILANLPTDEDTTTVSEHERQTPDFKPEDESSRLDLRTCPECGHEF
jgi:hypothetical protein